jgi:hypothetical protein
MVIANLSTDSIPFDLSSDSRFGTADSIAVPPKDAVFQQLEK